MFIPHGHCYLWQTNLVSLHVISDGAITLAYYSIPGFLVYVQKKTDVPFKGMFILFSFFILTCGTTHLLEIWTLWYPHYWLSGIVKAITALVSIYTVFELIPIIPQALSLPSPTKLEALIQENINLNSELETRIQQRTQELEESNYFIEKVLNLIPNIVYIYDLEGQINYGNQSLTEILGLPIQNLKNQGMKLIKSLCHGEDIELFNVYCSQFFENIKLDGLKIEYRLQDSKNQWRWFETINYVFHRDEEGNPKQIISISSEITELKESKMDLLKLNETLESQISQLRLRNQEMNQLGKINDFLQVCKDFEEVKKTLGGLLKPLFAKFNGAVFMLNNQTQTMEILSYWGRECVSLTNFNIDDCWALRTGHIYEANYNYPELYCCHNQQVFQGNNTLCIPMIAQGEITGLLSLYSATESDFTEEEISLAQTAAKQIALIIANLKLQENLQDQSNRDALTGLYNRRYLTKSFTEYLIKAKNSEQLLGVIIVDIDYFKKINDVYGHLAGDLVLQKVANYLKDNIRKEDLICRYGGEEIVIIIPNMSLKQLVYRAKKLQIVIKNLNLEYLEQKIPTITASFGIASFPNHGEDEETLIHIADKALYLAKAKGRNRVIVGSKRPDKD
ncbi:MAG: diguanylate cyclase [Gloeocapsa sp. DLM2.Bin57]|nr:MAG: diguanylate cyclase [Gloeocapsa sp. DLM2.Bin57]